MECQGAAGAGLLNSREAIRDLFDDYYATLDAVDLEAWPNFFTEDCVYRVISRENYERGFSLATIGAESRGMLMDRVTGLRTTQVYAPRYYRRFAGPLKIGRGADGAVPVEHNLLLVQTLIDKQSEIILSARCYDSVVEVDGRLALERRDVVFDSEMIPNSLIYPA
ncbi:SnoaL-like domain-containing protein [Sphingomonas sp. AP4-R1]|nr:SnoaL-like domain-containing protein [Sphingomonas sp. AP4-R1]